MKHRFQAHPAVRKMTVKQGRISSLRRSLPSHEAMGRVGSLEIINSLVVDLSAMYKLVLSLLGLVFLCGAVSAYQINIDAPATLTVGKPLIVSGTTNFGIGTPIDVVLYHQLTSTTEIKRKIAYVQSDHTFRAVFDTTNLEKGIYKVEVPASGLGDSVNMRQVELVDRSDEIYLYPGVTPQEFTGTLAISGTLAGNKNTGIQVEVTGPDGFRVFGPKFIPTDASGIFTLQLPITAVGTYQVGFTDTQGYIGTRAIVVTGGIATGIPSATPSVIKLSAHAKSSRDAPAYFEVRSGSGTMAVYTSSDINWVIEYADKTGTIHTVNDHGELNPEQVEIPGDGGPVYFKVYPYLSSDSGEVFLYVENARSLQVSTTVPAVFQGSNVNIAAAPATQAPLSPVAALGALLSVVFLLRFRK